MQKWLKDVARWVLARSKWVPLPIAAVYLALWIAGEAGRTDLVQKTVVFALFAFAIAFCALAPLVSLAVITAIPVLQLLGVLYPPTSTTWAAYFACGFVALMVGFIGEHWSRRAVLPVGIVVSLLFAVRLITPGTSDSWVDWVSGSRIAFAEIPGVVPIGAQDGPTYPFYPNREAFLSLVLGALVVYVGAWAIGVAMRGLLKVRAINHVLNAAEGRLEETDFELRLSQDRARISRDVHDALAHSLAVIVSQAEGAVALGGKKPQVIGEALGNIAAVGRTALLDVRGLVERIQEQDVTAASPRIADLDALIEHLRGIGMDVTFRVLGQPTPLSTSHELAVFRIVQESLTNALKHAGAPVTAHITLDWQGPGLAVLVTSRGAAPTGHLAGRGVGIAGMKERARLTGGWLTAAPADDNLFVVTGYIPAAPATAPIPITVDA